MKTKLLDYYKMVLDKVSFDAKLFYKEYQKAITSLKGMDEIRLLETWLRETGLHAILARSREEQNN